MPREICCIIPRTYIRLYYGFSLLHILFRSPSFGPQKTITTWLTKTEIFTLHSINIIRNNKCIFTKLNAVKLKTVVTCMNKKDILFFNQKLKYTFHKSTPTTQFVQRVQLSSEETVQWHKLWQLPDTNRPRQLQYINVFHQRKNKLWETLSQVLFVESNHLNYPQ